jgi:hypothetical protein
VLETTYFDTPVEIVSDARRVVCLQRPGPAHLLECHPPEQQRIGGLALLANCRLNVCLIDLGVGAGRVEPALVASMTPSSVMFSVTIRSLMPGPPELIGVRPAGAV